MVEIQALVKDSFEVISLILVFAFVLFDIRYRKLSGSSREKYHMKTG